MAAFPAMRSMETDALYQESGTAALEAVARAGRAMGSAPRLELSGLLAQVECSVEEHAGERDFSPVKTLQYLRVLREAGLLSFRVATGWLHHHAGGTPLIAVGMLIQTGVLARVIAGGGAPGPAVAAALLPRMGTAAAVSPALTALVSDAVAPLHRAQEVGVHRFRRDALAGALIAGMVASAVGRDDAIVLVAAPTAAGGAWVAATRREPRWALAASLELRRA
jgi:hypothetical protein